MLTPHALRRPPDPRLRAWVREVWSHSSCDEVGAPREHVLPTGAMHLAIRLHAPPLRLWLPTATTLQTYAHAVVGGPRASYYARELTSAADSVGAVLRPGAAQILLGVPAVALAGLHVELAALWGAAATHLREQLLDCTDPHHRLAIFEAALVTRLSPTSGVHPAVTATLANLGPHTKAHAMVAASGYSHRHFVALFRDAVGLGPKAYLRVHRFQHALTLLRRPEVTCADVAHACGYSDQAHLVREFQALAGVTPHGYRRERPSAANHLPRS